MTSTLVSVGNALKILHLLRIRGPLGVSEIAAELGIGLSTAHRLVSTLREERFVRQQASGKRYEFGAAMMFTASPSLIEHVVTVSAPVMRRLRDRTGETVHLSVLRGADCAFAASVESKRMVRVSSRVGQHPPAHTTAAGKVLLAALDHDRLLELLPAEELITATGRSLASRARLIDELRTVAATGYARNLGESEVDMYAIAVPIPRPDGQVVAGLSVAAPLTRVALSREPGALSVREGEHLTALRGAAQAIAARIVF